MARYSDTQKSDALKLANEIGVKRAQEQLGISLQTIYKWKNETKQPSGSSGVGTVKQAARKPRKTTTSGETIKELIQADDGVNESLEALRKENIRLMSENSALRTTNQKLREALTIFVK